MKKKIFFLSFFSVCGAYQPSFAMEDENANGINNVNHTNDVVLFAQDIEGEVEKVAKKIHKEMLKKATYENDDPVYNTLRRRFDYNRHSLTSALNYQTNLNILSNDRAKNAIREVTDTKVSISEIIRLGNKKEEEAGALLEPIKYLLFSKTHDYLVSCQEEALKDAQRGRISRIQ